MDLKTYKRMRKVFAINQKSAVFQPKKGRGSYTRKGRRKPKGAVEDDYFG